MKGKQNMNRYSLILTIFVLCTLRCAGQSNVVYYGTNSNVLDVVFVDTNLSQKAQSAIVADLNICLSEWGKTSELRLRDNEDSVGYLYNADTSPHYPEDIEFPRNIVSNGTASVALQITKELSDAYIKAFAFTNANAKAVKAAYEFVAFVSSTNFPNIPPKRLPDYILDKSRTQKEIIEDAQEIISQLRRQTYYQPSVLGFERIPLGPGIFSNYNLWVRVPEAYLSSYRNEKSWSAFPAIWHRGKWKFCHWPEEYED